MQVALARIGVGLFQPPPVGGSDDATRIKGGSGYGKRFN
jgi:hypothetical protein